MKKPKKIAILGILTLIVSLIFGLPHLLIPYLLNEVDYQPFVFDTDLTFVFEEAHIYAMKTREAMLSGIFLSEIQTNSFHDWPSPFTGESLPAIIMAVLAKITGSISTAFIVGDFVSPPLTFLLLFWFTYQISKDFLVSLLPGLATLLAHELIAFVPYPSLIDYYFAHFDYDQFLFFSRNFHPQISFPFFLLALIFFQRALTSGSKRAIIVAGLSFYPSNSYNHWFHYWNLLFFKPILFQRLTAR